MKAFSSQRCLQVIFVFLHVILNKLQLGEVKAPVAKPHKVLNGLA